MARRGRRKAWLMFAVVALGGALLVWTGLHLVNRRVEREMAAELDRAAARAGLAERFSYEAVDARVSVGEVTLRGVEYRCAGREADALPEGMRLRAESLKLDVPTNEGPRLLHIGGGFSFSTAELMVKQLEAGIEGEEGRFRAGQLRLEARGEISRQLFSAGIGELARYLFFLRVEMRDGELLPGRGTRSRLSRAAGFDPLREMEQLSVSRLAARASLQRGSRRVTVRDTELASNLLNARAEGRIELDEQMRATGGVLRLTVREMDQQLRRTAGRLLADCGAQLPQRGGFTLRLAAEAGGGLRCRTVEH